MDSERRRERTSGSRPPFGSFWADSDGKWMGLEGLVEVVLVGLRLVVVTGDALRKEGGGTTKAWIPCRDANAKHRELGSFIFSLLLLGHPEKNANTSYSQSAASAMADGGEVWECDCALTKEMCRGVSRLRISQNRTSRVAFLSRFGEGG